MSRTTFRSWGASKPGDILEGVWLAPRQETQKESGREIWLGEVEQPDGKRIVFTIPSKLHQLTAWVEPGTKVRIVFDGTEPVMAGVRYKFTVDVAKQEVR